MSMRVLIADDHAVVRRGVRQILAEDKTIQTIDEAASGQETLRLLQEKDYDLLLLDIAMPDKNGLEVLNILHKNPQHPRVLILSIYPEKQYALRALKTGAGGYLTKDSLPEELLEAVHVVAQGGRYISHCLAETLADMMTGNGALIAPHELLSEREYQVMIRLAAGQTAVKIASSLSLSVSTVSTYRRRILEKLRLHNTAEIIRYAIEHQLAK
jgi:two-component system, NarL family, invasion response regulator UvrY